MKGIPLKTWEARAILDGCKPVTRQVLKPQQPDWEFCGMENDPYITRIDRNGEEYPSHEVGLWATFEWEAEFSLVKAPYQPGDILYVRETWAAWSRTIGTIPRILYKADRYTDAEKIKWHPSIHMPFEAARIFLRVTNVKVQHVQDITDEKARKEGYEDREDFHLVWNDRYADPRPVKAKGAIDHYESYPWEDIRETRTYRGRPWLVIGNPWVFVSELEQCEKPKEDA